MTDIAYSLLVSLHPCLPTGRCHAVPHYKRTRKVKSLNSSAGFYFFIILRSLLFSIYLPCHFIYLSVYSVIYLIIYFNTSFRKYMFVRTEILGIFKSPQRES